MNGKFYVCSKFPDIVFYITCHTYIHTARYITDRHVRINGTLQYVAVSYVTLDEGGKRALVSFDLDASWQCYCIKRERPVYS